MSRFLHTILLLLFINTVLAQQPRHYNFTHYTVESGLISYQVNCCEQDKDGYIWIATNDGLQRYDGIRYKDFRHNDSDPSSIPGRGIEQILFDRNNTMWLMATDGVTGIFDRNTFTFKEVRVTMQNVNWLQSPQILKRLITDESGNMLLLLPGKEIATYSKQKNEFSAANNFFGDRKEWLVKDIKQQPGTKKYWLCVQGKGILVYDRVTGAINNNNSESEKIILGKCLATPQPYKIFFDTQDRLWAAAMDSMVPYLYCYDLKSGATLLEKYDFNKQVERYYEINDFTQQKDGAIWVTGVNIMARFLEKEKQFEQVYNGYVDDRSIEYVSITHIMEDKENNLWAGTGNNGLFRFNPSEEFFTCITHTLPGSKKESNAAPVGFMHDKDGSFLVGYWNEGLVRYNKDLEEIPLDIKGFAGNKPPGIPEMCNSTNDQFIWMGLQQSGLCRYDKEKRTVQYCHSPLLKSRIRCIIEDRDENLWMGLQEDGVFKWNAKKGKDVFGAGVAKIQSVPSIRINKIIIDKRGHVWVGTFGEGVYVIDPVTEKTVLHFYQKAPAGFTLPEQTVSSLLELNDSLIIIGTYNSLLTYNAKTNGLQPLGSNQSISGFMSSMEKDTNGFLWVSTTTALYRVDVARQLFVKYNRLDGIRNDFFILSASHVLPDGRIVLGSTATMVVFDPSSIKSRVKFPELHITDFKVMNRSLRLDSLLQQKEIVLASDENSISIAISTLSYSNPYVIKYKLEGLDNVWKTVDKTQEIIYSYLPPGKYRLVVNVMNEEGIVMEKRLELSLKVYPPFWRAWWFYSVAALAIGGLFFYLDRERMKRRKVVQDMRTSIASNLHQEVNMALNNINVLSEMAKLKADNEPAKSKEFIEQIHEKSGKMMYAMEDMLWSIAPENDSMEKTVQRMQEYIGALNSRYRSRIVMLMDENVEALKLDMRQRHEIFILFKETIQGMMRACDGNCKIHAGYSKGYLIYTIEFNSQGCDTRHLNNMLQARQMQKRLENIQGTVSMKTLTDTTIVEFRILV